jgi:hypothetical protein
MTSSSVPNLRDDVLANDEENGVFCSDYENKAEGKEESITVKWMDSSDVDKQDVELARG